MILFLIYYILNQSKLSMEIFFSLFILKNKDYDLYFFRSHIAFASQLLLDLSYNKRLYLSQPRSFYVFIINKIKEYKKEQSSCLLDALLNNVLGVLEKLYVQKISLMYGYVMNFIGIMLQRAYYEIAVIHTASIPKNYKDQEQFILSYLKQYNIMPKLVLISVHENLKKGMCLQFRNFFIDHSLKKLSQSLVNIISINVVKELGFDE